MISLSFIYPHILRSKRKPQKDDHNTSNDQFKYFLRCISHCNHLAAQQSIDNSDHYDLTHHTPIESLPYFNYFTPNFEPRVRHHVYSKYLNYLFSPADASRHLIIDEYPHKEDEAPLLSGKHQNLLRHFISGGLAGAISRTVVAPLDVIKVHLQVNRDMREDQQKSGKKSGPNTIEKIKHFTASPEFRNKYFSYYLSRQITHNVIILRKICFGLFNENGLFAFWKGNGINILKVVPEKSCRFMFYEMVSSLSFLQLKWVSNQSINYLKCNFFIFNEMKREKT
jgi:hypothetical protein